MNWLILYLALDQQLYALWNIYMHLMDCNFYFQLIVCFIFSHLLLMLIIFLVCTRHLKFINLFYLFKVLELGNLIVLILILEMHWIIYLLTLIAVMIIKNTAVFKIRIVEIFLVNSVFHHLFFYLRIFFFLFNFKKCTIFTQLIFNVILLIIWINIF